MTKFYSICNATTIDTKIQVVKENQIIIGFEAYMHESRNVVYKVKQTTNGFIYYLINVQTKAIYQTKILQPLSKKFGIGWYYDDINPEFMDAFEVAILVEEAKKKERIEAEKAEKERQRIEQAKEVGRKRLAKLLPLTAKAIIVARLMKNESDSQSDYLASSPVRSVILGFSTHTRNIFSEMRKYASNFSETAYLAEYNEDYEHREMYSRGAGYYLGESDYYGWIIVKVAIYNRERIIEDFAYTAANEDNIHLQKPTAANSPNQSETTIQGEFIIVDYSEKAIAIFGDTKPIKDKLSELGGRFNARLTYKGEKKAGWIFQKSKEEQVRRLIGTNE